MQILNLHSHSEFSNASCGFKDSTNKLYDLLDYAFDNGHAGIGLTDHETVTGHIRAFDWWQGKIDAAETDEEKERAENFKVVLGNEIYIAREDLTKDTHQQGENFFHFLLLAKDEKGQSQLRQLSTMAWERGYYNGVMRRFNYPSDFKKVIQPEQGHVFGTTACIANLAGHAFQTMPIEQAESAIDGYMQMMLDMLGKGNFYVELSPALYEEQIAYNKFMYERYKDHFPFVITNDVHYLEKEDFRTLEILLGTDREVDKYYSYNYFMTWEEISENMNYLPQEFLNQAAQNALDIGMKSEIYNLKHDQAIPVVKHEDYKIPEQMMEDALKYEYIAKFINSEEEADRALVAKVLTRYTEKEDDTPNRRKDVLERLNNEWKELWGISEARKTPISNYLLTMDWVIQKMWESGTLVGPGRGSAVAFVTNYYLDITDVNPLDYPLEIPYWRFISATRPEMPDIDVDSPGADRDMVLDYLEEEFSKMGGSVIQVQTYMAQAARQALKTIGKGLDMPTDTVAYITALIPSERGVQFTLQQTYYGDSEHKPVERFVELMDENPELWEHSAKIEGLITGMGVHPGGVILSNERIDKHNSVMRSKRGVRVTAYDLHESEDTGLIKYDILSVDALGKLKVFIYLLLRHEKIEWQGSLEKTFKFYFSPNKLEPDEKVWKNIAEGRVNSLFQLSTQVGQSAVRLLHVDSIQEIGMINSLMRLQPQTANDKQPIDVFAEYREDISLWYNEMTRMGLSDYDIGVMEEHLLPLSGVSDTQESIMLMSMDERVSNFTVLEANVLRKSVARKDPEAQEKVRQLFYSKGLEQGTSRQLLDYVWNVQVRYQLGYSFSLPHVAAYSYIALQEAVAFSQYPEIYWNTACLIDDAGAFMEEDFEVLIDKGYMEASDKFHEIKNSDDLEEVDIQTTPIDRDKIAASIAKFQEDMTIQPPDINQSGFGFTLDEQTNSVQSGLKVVSRLGNRFIYNIIRARPYYSFEEFIDSVKISRDRVVMLIKAGAFRKISNKSPIELLKDYVFSISDQKKVLNGRNVNMLITMNLLPESLLKEQQAFMWWKYISPTRNIRKGYVQLDEAAIGYYTRRDFDEGELEYFDNGTFVKQSYAKGQVDKTNDTIKQWIKDNHDELLEKVNDNLYQEMWEKYKMKSEAEGEMEALRMYTKKHPLAQFPISYDRLDTLEPDKHVGMFNIKGKKFPKHYIYQIIGTVVAKDKMKHTITLLTPEGAVNVKIWNDVFNHYDRKVSIVVDGVQQLVQDGFFDTGTHLVILGRYTDGLFFPKVYRDTGVDDEIYKINIVDGLPELEEKISADSTD